MEAIIEARKRIDMAKEMLTNLAKEKDGLYQDRIYVKKAGILVYKSVLKAIDTLLDGSEKRDEESYQNELYGIDKKITRHFVTAHQILNISMGSDRTRSVEIAEMGMAEAERIIGWVENRLIRNQK